MSYLTASISGLENIRCYGKSSLCLEQYGRHSNAFISTWASCVAVRAWFHVVYTTTAALFATLATLFCIILSAAGEL